MATITVAVTLCGAAGGRLQGQDTGKPMQVRPMARSADPDWEVATIKASDPNDTRGHDFILTGRYVRLLNITVRQLLLLGYDVQKSQLVGLPDWATETRWDINGTPDVAGRPSFTQLKGMARKILAERFGLKLHHEEREMSVFALRAGKGGPRMIANTSNPNGWLQQRTGENDGRHTEALKNISMAELATILQYDVDLPVVDQTRIEGRYDFNLQWTMDDAPTTASDAPPGLFTALQEQIGLELERVKAPADVLVIDKVARPGAN
ncbi:MAG: TIGR03435 family protein [Acidobacteriaceae bacterium]